MPARPADSDAAIVCGKKGWMPFCRSRGGRSPLRPALIVLALLVFLWGLGYKLSLYHHSAQHASLTRVAKLWTESRAAQLSLAPVCGQTEHSPSSAQALLVAAAALPPLRGVAATDAIFLPPAGDARRRQVPPRSPPSTRLPE